MKKVRNQRGFTLIEIIAVIVILGVLALVAIPRFNDLTDAAERASARQAVAEGIARVNASVADYILRNGSVPAADDITTPNTDAGDYTLAYTQTAGASTVGIVASIGGGTAFSGVAYMPTTSP